MRKLAALFRAAAAALAANRQPQADYGTAAQKAAVFIRSEGGLLLIMRSLRQEIRASLPLVLTPLLYATLTWLLLSPLNRANDILKPSFGKLVLITWGISCVMILMAYLVHLCLVSRPARPLRVIAQDVRAYILPPDQLVARLAPLIMLALLLNSFSAFKSAIPVFKPFAYDALFAEMDRIIFGTDPWRLTHAVFGSPHATLLLQYGYNAWFAIMWVSVIYAAVQTNFRVLRTQYLLAFCLCWIVLGSFAALALSSAGPCYYGLVVTGPDPFIPLMERLHTLDTLLREQFGGSSVTALRVQDMLWASYQNADTGTGLGISAMPSLHVAISVLMARAGFTLNRKLGWALSIFALVIWIGSVHLGWHYAVDGMVSAPLVLLIWAFAGRVVRWLGVIDPIPSQLRPPHGIPQPA